MNTILLHTHAVLDSRRYEVHGDNVKFTPYCESGSKSLKATLMKRRYAIPAC